MISARKTLYGPVVEQLRQVEEILRREMRSDYPYVDELVRYGCLLGGKRLRPALLLLVAKATGQVTEDHLLLAAVVEMIHTATLVHDDVLDDAAVRRHLETVNVRWDNEASVLLGDFLFTHAFYLASTLDSTLACRLIGRATNIVCEGEIRQKGSRGEFTLDEDQYLKILNAKTAELCACCCQLGAHFGGASDTVTERMTRYGRYLGIAFQIADDLLDVAGDESAVGKSLGSDLNQQKPTLPLIHALRVASQAKRERILAILESPRREGLEELRPLLEQLGAIKYSRDKAWQFAQRAREQLAELPQCEAGQTLRTLAEFVVERVH